MRIGSVGNFTREPPEQEKLPLGEMLQSGHSNNPDTEQIQSLSDTVIVTQDDLHKAAKAIKAMGKKGKA